MSEISRTIRERGSDMKNRMWFFIRRSLPHFGFSTEKPRGRKMCHAAVRCATEKERIEKGGRWKRATTMRRLQRGGKSAVEERTEGTVGYRWLAASDGEVRERRCEGRASVGKKMRKMRGTECGLPASLCRLAQCTPPAPGVTAVSLSLSLLSVRFFFFLSRCDTVVPRTFRVFVEYPSYDDRDTS